MNNRHIIIILACIVYAVSMFLPGIIYTPTVEDNEKNKTCSFINFNKETTSFFCQIQRDIYYCSSLKQDNNHQPTPRAEILKWCGKDWDDPVSRVDYGYLILAFGWVATFDGNFAWWGNPLFFIAVIFAISKNRKITLISSLSAFILGLMAFLFTDRLRNEGGVNDFIVDHLGSGYYLWMIAIAILIVTAIRLPNDNTK